METIKSLINEEAELVVIGTLVDNEQSHKKVENINSLIFSDRLNCALFKIIKKALDEGKKIDIPLLSERTKEKNINVSISSLTNLMLYSNIYTLDQNIQLLQDLYVKRNLFERAQLLKQGVVEGNDIDKLMFDFEEGTKDITKAKICEDSIGDIANRLLDNLEKGEEKGFKFGISILDRAIGGVFKGELTTIGAKSAVGKTALALSIVQEAIKQDKTVLIITREMKDEHITQRLITQQTGVSSKVMKTKTMSEDDWGKIIQSLGYLGSKKLYINHNISKPSEIRKRVREIKPDLVIIDYLQLLTSEKKQVAREQEVAYLSREMKKLTTDFDTSVIQLTQLNESFKGRPFGESAVRESRAIYHDSNNVVYIHKPLEYEELLEMANKDEKLAKLWLEMNINSPTKIYEVIVSKSRDSGTAIDKMWYAGDRLSFYNFK
jgi:replicative DNA helicase